MNVRKKHTGRNIKRFRELLGIRQDTFARRLGQDWTLQKVILLEQREVIEEPILEQVADILQLPAEVLRNFEEGEAVNIIANTFQDESIALAFECSFNAPDKIVQLYEEKIALYKHMLQEKEEQVTHLEGLLRK